MSVDKAMGEPRKRLTRMRYKEGPMGFLADQIIKEMQRAGYPAREFNLYRSPDEQEKMRDRRVSQVGPFGSAHQYYAASDIIHEKWAWGAAPGAPDLHQFWEHLWWCADVVSEKFQVEFSDRISWDPAHVQLANWKQFKEVCGRPTEGPNQTQLDWYFQITLPAVWKQHQKAKNG